MTRAQEEAQRPNVVVTKERLLGPATRWRRHGEPTLAGIGQNADHGVFGPGSIAWDILLHPGMIVFQSAAQFVLQLTYKPVLAGVRDWDPISRKAQQGTLTIFDVFDRAQRNSGIHAPMWLGDSATAKRVAEHLMRIHQKVAGDIIDVGAPELGGYSANSSRESMWAALTEMHSMLWVYESLAFRGLKLPRRLPLAQRDQFIKEVSEYCRLFPVNRADLPTSMAELQALYARDAKLFGQTTTMPIIPETGLDFTKLWHDSVKKNSHPSQFRVKVQLFFQDKLFRLPVLAAVSGKTRRSMGISSRKEKVILASRILFLPLVWLLQQRPIERYFMRMMWGPDAVQLILSARKIHAEAKKSRCKDLSPEAALGAS